MGLREKLLQINHKKRRLGGKTKPTKKKSVTLGAQHIAGTGKEVAKTETKESDSSWEQKKNTIE